MSELPSCIARNLADVRGRIADAAQRSGRSAELVTLVAVTKYVDVEAAAALLGAGCADLSTDRVGVPAQLPHVVA